MKYLLISGSPRHGNTDYILKKIFNSFISSDAEIIFLRDKKIGHCLGCLNCHKTNKCGIRDDMDEILLKVKLTDVLIIGSPNYFDNVPGLLKDFIDRTHPFYKNEKLKGKKLINIIIGGGKVENSKRIADEALNYFAECQKLKVINSYPFKGLDVNDVENDLESNEKIQKIIRDIKNLY